MKRVHYASLGETRCGLAVVPEMNTATGMGLVNCKRCLASLVAYPLPRAQSKVRQPTAQELALARLLAQASVALKWCRPRLKKSATIQSGPDCGVPLEAIIDAELEPYKSALEAN